MVKYSDTDLSYQSLSFVNEGKKVILEVLKKLDEENNMTMERERQHIGMHGDEKTIELMKGSEIFVINALRQKKHYSHFTLAEALELIELVAPKTAYLTHLSHWMGKHEEVEEELPDNVLLCYDGLRLDL